MQRPRMCLGVSLAATFVSCVVAIRVGPPGDDAKFRLQVESAWREVVESMLHGGRNIGEADDDGEEKAEEKEGAGPVRMQVSKEQIDDLVASLSKDCAHQFSASLSGDGPQLHTFGGGGAARTLHTGVQGKDVGSSNASCQALDGRLCETRANVVQQRSSDGRKIKTTTSVDGNGCLPRHCIGEGDLKNLARFMQSRAKETMPGMGVEVQLHVDCAASGGSEAAVGEDQVEDTVDHKAAYEKSKAEAERYVGKKMNAGRAEDHAAPSHSAGEKPAAQAPEAHGRSDALGRVAGRGLAAVLALASLSLL